MMVNSVATKPEGKLEDIRSATTRRVLARAGRDGLYLLDRLANTQCLLSWQALQQLYSDLCPESKQETS